MGSEQHAQQADGRIVVQMNHALLERMNSCKCERKELRWAMASNNVKYYRYQCVNCFRQSQNVSKVYAKGNERPLVVVQGDAWNSPEKIQERVELARARWQQRENERIAYMQTPKWRAKREAVMRRDNGVCQACLSARASDVHHLTYNHLFDEPLFDLIAVCRPCHDRITAMDRAKRGA